VTQLVGDASWKIIQMKTLFQILAHGQPMLEYESLYALFISLGFPNNPSMHCFDIVGWVLVEFMYKQIKKSTIKAIQYA